MTRRNVRSLVVFVIALFVVAPEPATLHAKAPTRHIAFELSGNHVMLRARVEHRDLWFLLDTGAATSSIDLTTALDFSAAVGSQFWTGSAGPGTIDGARLTKPLTADIPAGKAPVRYIFTKALDLAGISARLGRDVHGIIGADFIRRFVLEIDYVTQRLMLHDPKTYRYDGAGVTMPITLRDGLPTLRTTTPLSPTETLSADALLTIGAEVFRRFTVILNYTALTVTFERPGR